MGSHAITPFSRAGGAVFRRLRRLTQANANRTPIWDRAGEVPSAFATAKSAPSPAGKVENFFYKKLQYRGTADLAAKNKQQPQPQTMNFYERERD